MILNRSPPQSKHNHCTMGGSKATKYSPTSSSSSSPLLSRNTTCRSSAMSLYSNLTTAGLIAEDNRVSGRNSSLNHLNHHHQQGAGGGAHHHHHHHYLQHNHSSHCSSNMNGGGSSGGRSGAGGIALSKRGKKNNWGSRERAGMSFLIVIAFFAIFGLIILTEVFMIDEKTHGGMIALRHGNQGSRLGDSMPDYDNVKDEYELDDSILTDNKLGFIQFHDKKLKIQDASVGEIGRQAGVLMNSPSNNLGISVDVLGFGGSGGVGTGAAAAGANVPIIPWGKVLPYKIEETLPHYPIGMVPTDGSWQVVNGTRFKFFVFSAYYDRRDGAKLVRVVGATKTRGPERVWCRFWYANRGNGTDAKSLRYTSTTVMARVKIIRENWNLKYSACFVLCPIHVPEIDVPQYVSIVSRLRAPPGNILELRNTDHDADFATNRSSHTQHNRMFGAQPQTAAFSSLSSSSSSSASSSSSMYSALPTGDQIADEIAICVKPFHFNYDQALYLMEYLEFYALMGVSHFTFYNHTTGPHATCVLQHYMSGDVPNHSTVSDTTFNTNESSIYAATSSSNGNAKEKEGNEKTTYTRTKRKQPQQRISTNYVRPTINILPWNLRMRSQKEIRTEGLFAALNDCLYRTMYRYKYLALVDLDEFIIPRHNDTLKELINSLNQRFRNRNTAAYSFQNAFFYLQFGDDPLVYEQPEKSLNPRLRAALVTQRKTRRRYKLHPQKQRSKYICKPEAVIEAGNHFVWEFSPGRGSLNVPPTDAILHHYRVCEFGGNDCIKAPSTVDRTATKYANRLLQRVDAVYNYLKGPCDLPELPVLPTTMQNGAVPEEQQQAQKLTEQESSKQKSQQPVLKQNLLQAQVKKDVVQPEKASAQLQTAATAVKAALKVKNTATKAQVTKAQLTKVTPTSISSSTSTSTSSTKPRITKLFNEFKLKLKETIKARRIANNEPIPNTALTTTAKATMDNDYDWPPEQQKLVIFDVDAKGRPVIKVKYVDT